MKGMRSFVLKMSAGLAVLTAFSTISAADPFKPSLADQIKLGQQAAHELRTQKGVVVLPPNDRRVVTLRAIGANLIARIPEKERKERGFEYTFDIIDSKEVNAFALPGGPVFFYTGLLNKLSTEDEIAGILGHELTHVRNEHWAKQYADEQKRALGWLVFLSVIKANNTLGQIADVVNTVAFSLRYSRDHESEADRVGFDLMMSAGYNPQGMVEVFRILAKQGSGGPEFLNNHPDPGKRADIMEARIKAMPDPHFPAQRPFADGRMKGASSEVVWGTDGWATLVK